MHASSLLLAMPPFANFAMCNESEPAPPSLNYLLTVQATESAPMIVGNGGHGNRLFIPITGGTFSGPKLEGKVANAGGDWGNYDGANKIFAPDAKIVLETNDGALILVSGRGKSPYITYEFETGNEQYAWLNAAIGVGLIQVGTNNLTAEIFQCSALVAVLADKISFPRSQAYNISLNSYFSAQEAEVRPSCIVSARSTVDVSTAVGTLTSKDCNFAVRSGGHTVWAGAANIANEATIDLQGLSAVTVGDDKTTASVGPGSRWGDVYREVEKFSRVVAGGRVGTVGVGGLTLGGGISSFSPRYGWTCDTVKNFEIVLANGKVINANEQENADLLHALRGGSNNFGVVTRIDFNVYEQGDLWGGNVNYNFDTVSQQLMAFSNLASAAEYDEHASLVQNFAYSDQGSYGVSNTLQYTKAVEFPAFFRPFTDIPHTDDTLRIGNLSNFAEEGSASNPNGFRDLLATTSHGSSLEMVTAAFTTWNNSIAAVAGATGFQYRLISEPIPQIAYRKATPGTNVLGLSDDQGGLVIVGVAMAWTNASDDALMTQVAKDVVAEIDEQAKKLGQHFDLIYLNYASPWQKVIPSYGAQNVAKLKAVGQKYDPKGIFQRNVPGGFKLV